MTIKAGHPSNGACCTESREKGDAMPGNMLIPHSAPSLGRLEKQAVLQCLRSGFIGNGEAAKELEERICAQTGRKYAFAVLSGFHALLLSLRALDLKPKSKNCLPILTCASVLAAVQNSGHRAVLADIEVETLALDVSDVPRRLCSRNCTSCLRSTGACIGAPKARSAMDRRLCDITRDECQRTSGGSFGQYKHILVLQYEVRHRRKRRDRCL